MILNMKEIEGVKYDLAQDLLNNEQQDILPLYYQSYVICVAYALKTPEIKQSLIMWIIRHSNIDTTVYESDHEAYKIYDRLANAVRRTISKQPVNKFFDRKLECYHSQETINIMALQINELFYKCMEMKIENPHRFFEDLLNNLYFNKVGTINIRKTLDRLWQHEVLPKYRILSFVFFVFDESYVSRKEKELGEEAPETIDDWLTFMGNQFCDMKSFQAAVQHNNEIAVDYLWTNYISKLEDKYLYIKLVIDTVPICLYRSNVLLFLLFQVKSEKDMLDIFEEHAFDIIHEGNKSERWHLIVLKIFRMFKRNLSKENCKQILESFGNANYNYIKNIDSDLLREYFDEFNDEVRGYIVDCYQYKSQYTNEVLLPLLKGLVYRKGLPFLETFLEAGNAENWKNFFSSVHGMQLFSTVINGKYSNKFFTTKTLLQSYFTKKMLAELKIRVFRRIKNRGNSADLKDLKDLIVWCNPGGDELRKFKRSFENKKLSKVVKEFIDKLPY